MLARHNDEMLDSMKTFADRLVKEKQAATDTADHYKRLLWEQEKGQQALVEEVTKGARVIANQRVLISEGNNDLQRLQDKLKVSDAIQSSLHDKLAAHEKLLSQMAGEKHSLEEAIAKRLSAYEAAVDSVKAAHSLVMSQRDKAAAELELHKAAMGQAADTQKMLENKFREDAKTFAAEKEGLLGLLASAKAEMQAVQAALQRKEQGAHEQQVQAQLREESLNHDIDELKGQLESNHNAYNALKDEVQASLRAAEAQSAALTQELASKAEIVESLELQLAELRAGKVAAQDNAEALTSDLDAARQQADALAEELNDLKASNAAAAAAAEEGCNSLRSQLEGQAEELGRLQEENASMKTDMLVSKKRFEEKQRILEEEVKQQEQISWTERDRLQKLQAAFAEQYETLSIAHAKEVRRLQDEAERAQQATEELRGQANARNDETSRLQADIVRLEAARVTMTAFHSAQLEDAATARDAAVQRQGELAAADAARRLADEAALKTELQRREETAASIEKKHSEELAELRAELEQQRNVADELKKEHQKEMAALSTLIEDLQAAQKSTAAVHEEQLSTIKQETDFTAQHLADENKGLAEHIEELDGKLADALKLAAAKEESLDTMRAQARMRESRLAELLKDIEGKEELLKCISSAAANARKTPAKIKPRPVPASPQPSRFREELPVGKKRHAGNKKRRIQTVEEDEGGAHTQKQGIDILTQRQQQQEQLAGKLAGRKSGRTIFGSMSAEPIIQQQMKLKTAAMGLFGKDIANPY